MRYVIVADIYWICRCCTREFQTSFLKTPSCCPWCRGMVQRKDNDKPRSVDPAGYSEFYQGKI